MLFSTPMVQAILNETKLRTRRIIKADLPVDAHGFHFLDNEHLFKARKIDKTWSYFTDPELGSYPCADSQKLKCPYGQIGDIIWIREAWKFTGIDEDGEFHVTFKDGISTSFYPPNFESEDIWFHRLEKLMDVMYKKDKVIEDEENERFTWNDADVPWKPSIHMPKDVCRIHLKITDIRIEKLHEISESDAIKEGIEKIFDVDNPPHAWIGWKDYSGVDEIPFNNISPEASFHSLWESINGKDSWKKNPWVWVIHFEKTEI